MDGFFRYGGVIGSIFSVGLTVFFWFIKARGERPNLRAYVIDREIFLGNMDASQRVLGIKLGLVIANYSTLPNALLSVTLALKKRDGTWLAVEGLTFDQQTPPPFNLPALQTVLVRVNARLRFPLTELLEKEKNIPAAYVSQFLDDSRVVQVELKALNDKMFKLELA